MLITGLTGGIATGKSTVSRLLQTEHHIPIIDADVLARQVVEPGTPAYRKIVEHFGQSILLPGQSQIDRKKLGDIVFHSSSERKVLNGIVHPAVRWAMVREVFWHWWGGTRWVVLDVPLLIEAGIDRWVRWVGGEVVVVYCPSEMQIERVMRRDGVDRSAAEARVKSQMGIEEKVLGEGVVVIDNQGNADELAREVRNYVMRR